MKHLHFASSRYFLCVLLLLLINLKGFSQDCGCTYVIPFNSHPDGDVLNIKPGDVICFNSAVVYNNIKFSNIHGTEANPVIIKNCNGQAVVNSTGAYGVKFDHCSHFKILGNGDVNHQYGIKITTRTGFYLTLEEFSTNFEVAHIEIAGGNPTNLHDPTAGFAGIGCKTKPHCDGTSNRGVFTMYNPIIHDNYIHHTGGEGMYVGHGFYKGRPEVGCPDSTFSHSIVGLRLYNNIIEHTGYDGIQVKNADADCEIYNNVVRDFGVNNEGPHNEGLFMGEGVTGKAYNNWIENGTGHGIQFQGIGNNDIFNNVVINAAGNGVYAAHGPYVVRRPGQYFNFFNNTFVNCGGDGFVFFNNDGGPKRLINNVFVNITGSFLNNGATLQNSNNYNTNTIGLVNFADPANLDFHPLPGSPLIDAGLDLSAYGISFDHDDLARPFGTAYDIGAYEFGSTLNIPPVVSLTAPTGGSTFVAGNPILLEATASDVDGTIAKVEFYDGTVKIGEDLTGPYSFSWNTALAGTHNLIARAIDDGGALRSSTPVTITVTNDLPVVVLTSPANNATFPAGSNIVLAATATDTDGTIVKVEFLRGTTVIGEALTAPYTITWNNVPVGMYNLTARATDNGGGVSISPIINITVVNLPPVVTLTSPADASSFPAGSSVTFSATASDPDGTISKVEFYYGTTKIGEDLTAPYSITNNTLPVGVHSITARATDNGGSIANSTAISITVTNVLPNVSITSPVNNATFSAGSVITIDATASDADGSISKVEFFYGTTKIGEDLTGPYSIAWSNPLPGTYSLVARATDNSGAIKASSPVAITITNTPPTVSITAPVDNAQFASGATITFNATAADVDGSIAKVEFFQGTTKIGEDLTAPYSLAWVASLPTGTYNIIARATDNAGLVTSSSPIRVRIVNTRPDISITSPATQTTFVAFSDITIEVSATDIDGTVSKVEFYNGAVKIGEDLTGPYSFVWTAVPEGTYSITATATDNVGGVKVSAPITIVVNNISNIPPVVSITSPADGAIFDAGDDITFTANASDADGTIAKVEFYEGNVKLGEVLTGPYVFTWVNVPLGNYSITAKAFDNFGETTTSTVIDIAVDNLPPTISITSPLDNDVVSAGTNIPISVNALDSDGTIVKVEYFQGGIKLGESLSSPFGFVWNNVPIGSYNITAIATDNAGATGASSPITISVINNAPLISITSPLNDATVSAGSSITLDVNATDSDGSVLKVEFFQGSQKIGESLTTPFSFVVGSLAPGSYSFTAVATDNVGESTISSPITINVVNASPLVSLTSPANNSSFFAGATVTITATASDPDGTITKVEFYEGGIKLGESLTAPYSFTWSNLSPGSYSITAVATDNAGSVTSSQPININVANYLPTVAIIAPLTNSIFTVGDGVAITANATDPDGSIVKVEFFQGNVKLGESLTDVFTFIWPTTASGTYVLTAVATDNQGGTDTSAGVTITIREPNQLPVVSITSPVANTQFSGCASIAVTANAVDNDGTVTRVEFYLDDDKIGQDLTSPYSFTINNLNEGTYYLNARAFDNSGEENTSAFIQIVVRPRPLASFVASAGTVSVGSSGSQPLSTFAGDTISFANTTDMALYGISTWSWNFKDNAVSTEMNPEHSFATAGVYDAELIVFDASGCQSSAGITIVVEDTSFSELFIPKAFSPNEKNPENKVCKVYGTVSFDDFSFQIVSRWGQVVYETQDFTEANTNGWNGGSSPMGAYTYVVKGKYNNGKPFEKAGIVNLIR